MNPGKLKLLAAWMPAQPWYQGTGRPELAKVGGFRLDDPQGETGSSVADDGPPGTDLRVETAGADGPLLVRVHRVLEPGTAAQPGLSATWRQPDGTTGHGIFASVQGPAVP